MTADRMGNKRFWLRLWLPVVMVLACTEQVPTDPGADPEARFAKPVGGGGGGGGPTVKATDPTSGARASTVSVRVIGSNYVAGSRAVWALNGDSTFATTRVKTNSTTYVSSKELVASITIESDASVDQYDVIVITPAGKKGIGIELFEVTPEIVDLGAGDGSTAYAVNDAGQVVGGSRVAGGNEVAFIWEDGVLQELGFLPGYTSSLAMDIDESGQVVGWSYGPDGARAFIWTSETGMQPLQGTLGGQRSEAWGINENGDVVGASTLPGDTVQRATLWRNGAVVDLQAALGEGTGFAWDLSDAGTAVGTFYATGVNAPFRWTSADGIQLMWLGTGGEALGINSAGVIAGWKPAATGDPPTAYIWTNGVFRHLGTLGGSTSVAMAINDLGAVVGRAATGSRRGGGGQSVAFIWTEATGMRNLGLPTGSDFGWAWDINETGIVAGVTGKGGPNRATIWRFR